MSDVTYEAADGVAVITLNRPERLNAWTGAMAAGLRDSLKRAEADAEVRAIVLTGAGRGFCAGADMNLLQDVAAAGESAAPNALPFDPTARPDFQHPQTYLAAVGKPIIAAINGPAAGMGLCISLFCDLRFMADGAFFTSAFARRGLIAEHGTSWMLSRLVGHSRALDIMLSSRRVGAEECLRIGLADRVFMVADLLREAKAYAKDLADNVSPRSMRVIKRQMWNALVQDLAEAMKDADREMALSLKSDDFKEGVASFVEKRQVRFTGA